MTTEPIVTGSPMTTGPNGTSPSMTTGPMDTTPLMTTGPIFTSQTVTTGPETMTTLVPTTTTTAFDPVAMCPEKGTMVKWKGWKFMSKLEFYGVESAYIRTNVYNNSPFDIINSEYLGFLSFPKKKCGMDLVDAFVDGRLSWSIVDYGPFYYAQYAYKRLDKNHSSATLQFHRFVHSQPKDLGSAKKDQFYLILNGIDQVNWGGKDMEACLTGFQIGSMEITEPIDPTANHAMCAGWDKDLGW